MNLNELDWLIAVMVLLALGWVAWITGLYKLDVGVVGNVKNLMGPYFNGGLPIPFSWLQCPQTAPPGNAYRFQPARVMAGPCVDIMPT